MGLRTMWFSAVTVVLGAIFWRILDQQLTGVDLDVVAVALMVAGSVGLGVSLAICTKNLLRHPHNSWHAASKPSSIATGAVRVEANAPIPRLLLSPRGSDLDGPPMDRRHPVATLHLTSN